MCRNDRALILTFPVSRLLVNMAMTSTPCSYTITQKSITVDGSGACVEINFGQEGDNSCQKKIRLNNFEFIFHLNQSKKGPFSI